MAGPRSVLVTGASGLVGRRLVQALRDDGLRVQAATRRPERAALPAGVEAVGWDGTRLPARALAGLEALVHLSGEPVFGGPLTRARRERVFRSRIDSTRALVDGMAELPSAERPKAFVCASAVGYYGSRGDDRLDESAPPGGGFLADLCVAWEEEARRAAAHGVRTVSLRIGVVLAREGGALAPLLRVFGLGLGGRLGSGAQWVPWIHAGDLVSLCRVAAVDPRYSGAVNAVAPEPVRNRELTRELAMRLHRPALLAVPAFALRALLGELSGELLGSRRVVPRRAIEAGFAFAHPDLASALAAELGEGRPQP